jgi:hypothetical protein
MKVQGINNQDNLSYRAYFKPNTEFKKLWAYKPSNMEVLHKKIARIKNYVINSAIFGAVFGVMDIVLMLFTENEVSDYKLTQVIFPNLTEGLTLVITAVIAFVTMFAVSFVLEYFLL